MKKITRNTIILTTAYIIVLIVNIVGNYKYYQNGGAWQSSILFSLSVTTILCLGYLFLNDCVLVKLYNWQRQPLFYLFISFVAAAIYGAVGMILIIKTGVYILDWKELPVDNYIINSLYSALITAIIVLIGTSIEILALLLKAKKDNDSVKQEMLKSQYEVLKNQVNPHFLFNSLNTLSSLIREDSGMAAKFVQEMSTVFRYSLLYADENTVELDTELRIVKAYLFLNKQRFEDKLIVDIKSDSIPLGKRVITQSLLMVIENAIKHNEISSDFPLSISLFCKNGFLVVSNTNQPRSTLEVSTGLGQRNIINRYKLTTEKPVEIISDAKLYTIKLPLI